MAELPGYGFTAHNIALPDGGQTFPDEGWFLEDSRPCQAALRTLRMLFSPEEIPQTSVVDLGCLEGGYTVAFARAGFQSLGVDAREINIAKCEYVAGQLRLPNLRFVLDDVRNLERYGAFDAVFCSGLLYHLDNPAEYLETFSRCSRRALILQTHYATERLPDDPELAAKLSSLVTHENQLGRWYTEFPSDSTQRDIDEAVWSAWGNERSFWLDKRHLLQTLRAVGFDVVYEQFDFLADVVADPYIEWNSRSMFVAIKN